MIAGTKNVLTGDEKLTVNLQRRRQLVVCSRCLEPQPQKLGCRLLTAVNSILLLSVIYTRLTVAETRMLTINVPIANLMFPVSKVNVQNYTLDMQHPLYESFWYKNL